MKTTVILTAFLIASCLCKAQVTMQPLVPQTGAFQKSQLWNMLVVNNSPGTASCSLVLSLQDRETGTEAMSATSTDFIIEKGPKQLSAASIGPIQYTYFSFAGDNNMDGFLPVGSYNACYKLLGGEGGVVVLAEACVPFDVAPLSPPALITPIDSSVLQIQPAMFTWQPPAPLVMFQQLHYELIIAEVLPGQTPQEAVELNAPVYTDLNEQSNIMNYTGAYPSLEKGKWYAWQVVALDGGNYAAKTEVWDFMIDTATIVNNIVKLAPYIQMKKEGFQKGVAPNNILKVSYTNETTDSTATIQIIDPSSQDKKHYEFKVPVKKGENLIEYDLGTLMPIKEGKAYVAQIINSRNERWFLQFQVHAYGNKEQQ
jgi:hypothetical protein